VERLRFEPGDTVTMRILPLPKMTYIMKSTAPRCLPCESGSVPVQKTYHPLVLSIQFRFPRSKKVRIRKKWRKQPRNFKTQVSTIGLRPYQVEALKAWVNR
jgi:hypothetical protein